MDEDLVKTNVKELEESEVILCSPECLEGISNNSQTTIIEAGPSNAQHCRQ